MSLGYIFHCERSLSGGINRREGLRFFDDDPGCHRKYLAGYQVPVENFDDFVAAPPKHVFIASLAFADGIREDGDRTATESG